MNVLTPISSSDKKRTIFVLSVMTFGILLLAFDSIQKKGWITAEWWGYGLSATFLSYALIKKDKLLLSFFIFSLTAGFAELIADAWLVDFTKTLVYPRPEPMLLSSPFYMPFSWAVVLIEVGYIGWLVSKRWGILKASLCLCLLGAVLVPLYEKWAIASGWWYYHNTPKLFGVPKYVILAEGLLMFSLPFLLGKVERSSLLKIVFCGLVEGVVMLLACIIAFAIFG
jgi:hypothetical protein